MIDLVYIGILGRSLSNSVINLGIRDQYADALKELGFEFEVLAEQVGLAFTFLHFGGCTLI